MGKMFLIPTKNGENTINWNLEITVFAFAIYVGKQEPPPT